MDFCESQIILTLQNNPDGLKKGEIADKIGFHRKTIVKALYRLVRQDIIKSEHGTRYSNKSYRRNEKFYIKGDIKK